MKSNLEFCFVVSEMEMYGVMSCFYNDLHINIKERYRHWQVFDSVLKC